MTYELYTERPELTAPRVFWYREGDLSGLRAFLKECGHGDMVVSQEVTESGEGGLYRMERRGGKIVGWLENGVAVAHFPQGHKRYSDVIRVVRKDDWDAEYMPLSRG